MEARNLREASHRWTECWSADVVQVTCDVWPHALMDELQSLFDPSVEAGFAIRRQQLIALRQAAEECFFLIQVDLDSVNCFLGLDAP